MFIKKKTHVASSTNAKVVSFQQDSRYFSEKALQSWSRLQYEKALKYFRRAVEVQQANSFDYCNLAGVLSEMGNYEESNQVLMQVVEKVDPTMTECYFFIANNYMYLSKYEQAEEAIVYYLENDHEGNYVDESEELMKLLCYELERPLKLIRIKSREGFFEHVRARELLEEGKFHESSKLLEYIVHKQPDFLAARNNLALAYYYMGQFEKSMSTIIEVLEIDSGNLHALCNLAIFHKFFGNVQECSNLSVQLRNIYPMQQEQVFKLATTMGILEDHDKAYRLFKRLTKMYEDQLEPCMYHYLAVAACHIGRFNEAKVYWRQTQKLDPGSKISEFYLDLLELSHREELLFSLNYHYHLPYEEQFRIIDKLTINIPEHVRKDPLVRSSFFWSLRNGNDETKLNIIQIFDVIADTEVIGILKDFILDQSQDDYLKRVAIFVLRSLGEQEPLHAYIYQRFVDISDHPYSPALLVWEKKWQEVLHISMKHMKSRYLVSIRFDVEILWVEYLIRISEDTPRMGKSEGWAAALEYMIAKMHNKQISYLEVAHRYDVASATVVKHVKELNRVCQVNQKMEAMTTITARKDVSHID